MERGNNIRESSRAQVSSNWRVKDESPRLQQQSANPASIKQGPQQQRLTERQSSSRPQFRSTAKSERSRRDVADHSDRPDRPGDPTSPPSTRVYVGNLSYSVQPQVIEQLFADHGFQNFDIVMSIDPFSGRNPSYCFVSFETEEDAKRAMEELNGKVIAGRPVKMNPSVPKRTPNSDVKVKNWSWGKEPNVGKLSLADESSSPAFDRWSRTDAPDFWFGQSSRGKRLYVGGLPRIDGHASLETVIQKNFSGFKIEAVSKLISPHASKRSQRGNHYYVFVDLETSEEAERAVKALDGQPTWWGGKLQVRKARVGSDSRRVLGEQCSAPGDEQLGQVEVLMEDLVDLRD